MAARLLLSLITALALVGGGYWWGQTATDNAWIAHQAKADAKARIELDKANERADKAAGQHLQDHLDQEDRYAELDSKYQALRKRAPLVVQAPAPRAPQCGSTEAPGRVELPADTDAGDVPRLTLAAVRMWNGALAGSDAPAGACGITGATEGADAACAEDSGLTLDHAWDNHRANAKSCADDRQRYRALIEFLNHRDNP